jgi:hypothetical protein
MPKPAHPSPTRKPALSERASCPRIQRWIRRRLTPTGIRRTPWDLALPCIALASHHPRYFQIHPTVSLPSLSALHMRARGDWEEGQARPRRTDRRGRRGRHHRQLRALRLECPGMVAVVRWCERGGGGRLTSGARAGQGCGSSGGRASAPSAHSPRGPLPIVPDLHAFAGVRMPGAIARAPPLGSIALKLVSTSSLRSARSSRASLSRCTLGRVGMEAAGCLGAKERRFLMLQLSVCEPNSSLTAR